MYKMSGVVVDHYDDVNGSVLKSIYSSLDKVPENVKTASRLSHEKRDALPDDLFALVLEDNGHKLRKFACVDGGNVELSMEYLLKTCHKLSPEQQKTAAANLVEACSWYGLQPKPEVEKLALSPVSLLVAPLAAQGAHGKIKQNKAVRKAHGGIVDAAGLTR
jgi:hypothetical protein